MSDLAGLHPVIFLGANTPWVYALAEAMANSGRRVKAIAIYDSHNFRRLCPRWPRRTRPATLECTFWVFPSGYAGTLAPVFAPILRWRLNKTVREFNSAWIVTPYPWFVSALHDIPNTSLIYYNLDDYVLYHPARSMTILRQESELVKRAALTLCLSQRQVETLRSRFPDKSKCIKHFPLGVVRSLLNPSPVRSIGGPIIGYIGNLIDRVDWQLVCEVAQRLPHVDFQFIGSAEDSSPENNASDWKSQRLSALALPNVSHIESIAQDDVGKYYWSFAVNWMPYRVDHPFNQASCPTKIMDGLASGRPLISTDVPECRLYGDWISIVRSSDDAVMEIRRVLDEMDTTLAKETSQRQVQFVGENHTWATRAELIERWLLPR